MPTLLATVFPAAFGVAGAVPFVTGLGTLTLAGSIASIGSSLLLSSVAARLVPEPDVPEAARPENVRLSRRESAGPRVRHYGEVKVGGTLAFFRAKEGKLYRILVHGHGEVDEILAFELDGQDVTRDGSNYVAESQYTVDGTPRVRLLYRAGQPNQAYHPALEAAYPAWDSDHRLRGLWYSLTIAEQVPPEEFRTVYPRGEPELVMTARTSLLYDPRTASTAYSENAALVIADYLEHADGMGLNGLVDDDVLETAADDCDEQIALDAGGTEARYRLSGSYALTEAPQAVLGRMLAACAGDLQILPSGKVGIHVGRWRAPTVTLGSDEILRVDAWDSGPDRLDRYTELPITYVDRGLDYQSVSAESWVDATRQTENGGEPAIGPRLDVAMAPSHGQARRCGKYRIEADNPRHRLVIACKPKALRAIYERFIELDVSELPDVYWRVINWSVQLETCEVTLTLAAFDEGALSWSSSEEGEPQELPTPDTEDALPAPSTVAAAAQGKRSSQTNYVAGIGVTWDAPSSDALAPVVEYSPAGDDDWERWGVSDGATRALISPLVDGGLYDIRVAFFTADGNRSSWVEVEDVTAAAVSGSPAAATGVSITDDGGGNATVSFTTSSSDGLWKSEIRVDGTVEATVYNPPKGPSEFTAVQVSPGAGTYDFVVRSYNVSGAWTDTAATSETIT